MYNFILVSYFCLLILIGVYCSRKQKNLADFFLASRTIPAWAALAAIVATETSAITFIGAPAISFVDGGDFSFLQFAFGLIIARVILAIYFLPKFFEHEIVTIYEYLGIRFGKSVQYVAGYFFFVTRALAAGVRHYAAALVLTSITGIDLLPSILITGVISLIYSILGGLSAVIWTEVFQFGIMIAGAVLALLTLSDLVPGGIPEIVAIANANGKLTVLHWDWSGTGAYSFFAGLLGGTFLSLGTHGADQDVVQRLLSCKNLRSARIAIVGSGLFVFIQFAFFLFLGISLYALYGGLPEGLQKTDEIFPHFIKTAMSPAAGALVIAAVLSAALSSTASALNSLSSTAVQDFVPLLFKTTPSDAKLIWISRGFTLFWIFVLMLIAFIAQNSKSILDTGLSIPSLTYGSLLAAFLLGIFTPIRKQTWIIVSMLLGLLVVLGLHYAGIHWTWFVPSGTLTSITAAMGLHYLVPAPQEEKP
jgi:solute:Na+ symporter, SSS family